MSGHGIRWWVFWAALGALAGFGVAMTIVKAAGWYPLPETPAWVEEWQRLPPDYDFSRIHQPAAPAVPPPQSPAAGAADHVDGAR